MALLPTHPADSDGTEALPWPVLATIFLIGIGLVSLGDIVSGDDMAVPALDLPANWQAEPLWLLAPGWEDVLGTLPNPARARVLAPWEWLPVPEEPVVLARPQGYELPRVPDGVEVGEEVEAGAWVLTPLRPTQAAPVAEGYDLMDVLRRARVAFVHPDGTETLCDRWRFGRWACGLEEWLWVGPTQLPFRDRNRACLWAHPRAGDRLEIRFEDVPIGRRVSGRYGLSDLAVDAEDGASVEMVVSAGGQERAFVAENRRGFFSWDLDTEPTEHGEIGFSVTAERDGRRHFCFTGNVRGVGGQPVDDAPALDDVEDAAPHLVPPPSLDRRARVRRGRSLTHVEGSGDGTGAPSSESVGEPAGEGAGTGGAP